MTKADRTARLNQEELNEKRDLLRELHVLEQKGVHTKKRFTIEDDIEEIQFEYQLHHSQMNLARNIGTSILYSLYALSRYSDHNVSNQDEHREPLVD